MKKIYLLGFAGLVAGSVSAQSLQTKAPQSGIYDSQTLTQDKDTRVNASTSFKAAGDIVFSEDFANGWAAGWSNDVANQPAIVDSDFKFELDTFRSDIGAIGAPQSPTAANGFSVFNPRYTRMQKGYGFAAEPCWAGLLSPVIDLSSVDPAELGSIQLSFANYVTHCCNLDFGLTVDFSFDGGATFLATNSFDVNPVARNVISDPAGITTVGIGTNLLAAGDVSQVVMRFTWDSTVGDGNGQTSTEYNWVIDDVTLSVAQDWDFYISEGFYGDPRGDWDYRQLPERFIKDYPIAVEVKNDGSKPGLFTANVELENVTQGITKTYASQPILLDAFADTFFTIATFTDYDSLLTWTGEWTITHYIDVNAANPDGNTNALDTAAVVSLFVTDSVWSHARPWTTGVQTTPTNQDNQVVGTPYGQVMELPPLVSSARVTGVRIALHDDAGTTPITVPNSITLELKQFLPDAGFNPNSGFDENFLAYYYSEANDEVDGVIFIDESNRAARLTQEGSGSATFITGKLFNPFTEELFVDINREDNYFLQMTPDNPINICSNTENEDNSKLVFGNLGGSGTLWYGTDGGALLMDLIIEPLSKVTGIEEATSNNFKVGQNVPNPFTGSTVINYTLNTAGNVALKVMDITGKTVVEVAAEQKAAGDHKFEVNSSNLNNGIYFYSVVVNGESITKRMIVNK